MKYLVTRNANPVSMANEFDSLFNSFWNNWGVPSSKIPPVDIHETDDAYVLEAELPGYVEKDVNVSVEKHVLRISSVKEASREEKADEKKHEKNYLVRERYYQTFERSFTLPEGVDEDHISGEFKNGVLELTMPKLPVEKPKKIDVKIN